MPLDQPHVGRGPIAASAACFQRWHRSDRLATFASVSRTVGLARQPFHINLRPVCITGLAKSQEAKARDALAETPQGNLVGH